MFKFVLLFVFICVSCSIYFSWKLLLGYPFPLKLKTDNEICVLIKQCEYVLFHFHDTSVRQIYNMYTFQVDKQYTIYFNYLHVKYFEYIEGSCNGYMHTRYLVTTIIVLFPYMDINQLINHAKSQLMSLTILMGTVVHCIIIKHLSLTQTNYNYSSQIIVSSMYNCN